MQFLQKIQIWIIKIAQNWKFYFDNYVKIQILQIKLTPIGNNVHFMWKKPCCKINLVYSIHRDTILYLYICRYEHIHPLGIYFKIICPSQYFTEVWNINNCHRLILHIDSNEPILCLSLIQPWVNTTKVAYCLCSCMCDKPLQMHVCVLVLFYPLLGLVLKQLASLYRWWCLFFKRCAIRGTIRCMKGRKLPSPFTITTQWIPEDRAYSAASGAWSESLNRLKTKSRVTACILPAWLS